MKAVCLKWFSKNISERTFLFSLILLTVNLPPDRLNKYYALMCLIVLYSNTEVIFLNFSVIILLLIPLGNDGLNFVLKF
jgi:hypothetical protein